MEVTRQNTARNTTLLTSSTTVNGPGGTSVRSTMAVAMVPAPHNTAAAAAAAMPVETGVLIRPKGPA